MSYEESQGCLEPPDNWPKPAASEGATERLSHEESLSLAERLPPAKVSWAVKANKPWKILKVPEGYERLSLDGKIAYLGQNKMPNADPRVPRVRYSVADPRIRYFDGRCAAVGPGNSPLGDKNVDRLWINGEGNLTLDGDKLEPESDIVQQYNMLQYENARFVRQNFPSNKFEGGSEGSKYSSDGNGDGGKGKGKAKAESIEALNEGLTFPQKQAMDLQMDHDLAQTSDQIIRDWWESNHKDSGPVNPPSFELMKQLYWAQNNVKGPGPGDYDDWGSRAPAALPTVESESPPNSDADSDETGDTVIHHDVGNGEPSDSEDAQDDQAAKAEEEALRDQIEKADKAIRKEERLRQAQEKLIKESMARQAIREQIRKADEDMMEEGKAREEEARIMKEEDFARKLRKSLEKEKETIKEERKARKDAAERLRRAKLKEKLNEAYQRTRPGRTHGDDGGP